MFCKDLNGDNSSPCPNFFLGKCHAGDENNSKHTKFVSGLLEIDVVPKTQKVQKKLNSLE